MIVVAATMTLMTSATQAQTQQPSLQSSLLKGVENLRTAHTSCVERTFHLSDTNPATVE
jgi:hypothetical protein